MPEIDKQHLYGQFQAGEDRRAALAHKMARKALDIAEDDMNIDARRTNTGIGTGGAIGIAVAAGLPGLALAALLLLKGGATTPAPAPQAPQIEAPAPRPVEWDIQLKWDGKQWQKKVVPVQEGK